MGSGYKARKKPTLPQNYIASKEEQQAWKWCTDNNVRIGLEAADKEYNPNRWKIAVSLGYEYKQYHLSPSTYTKDNVWQEYYKACLYYYNKHNKK